MTREELMKKLELARVGNGTQTYNDVVLTLSKEETLELFKYIEQLEKENQELKEKNLKISIENNNSKIVEEMNKTVVENKNKQLLKATELNITYLDKIIMLKKAIKILKDKIEFEDLGEMQSGNVYRGYFNDCLGEEDYELLKQVFESVGDSDEQV